MNLYFSDFFNVPPAAIEGYGAFNISLVSDLPLFIDPFLLFNSEKIEYQTLHEEMIRYLRFLRDKSAAGVVEPGLLRSWYRFPEIEQTWFGFTLRGNSGRGLGPHFANALNTNLSDVFRDFGDEKITHGSHLEKLCLIKDGVGNDSISDFTTNLIHGFLLEYSEQFAKKNIDAAQRRRVTVNHVRFNYTTEVWERGEFDLPWLEHKYVLLTPRDILTKDDTWINRHDLIADFDSIPNALPNDALRAQVNNYFRMLLPRNPKKKDEEQAALRTIQKFPELIDAYIRYKEENGERAVSISDTKVGESRQLYNVQFGEFVGRLEKESDFFRLSSKTYGDAMRRVMYMKDLIENKGCHKYFYVNGKPVRRESDLQILYRFTWRDTDASVSREVNDGRGPVDYLVTEGASDKTAVEFKLAWNTQLKRNLANQAEVYQRASDAEHAIKVVLFFSAGERRRVEQILRELGLTGHPDIVLIDARADNKPSGSRA